VGRGGEHFDENQLPGLVLWVATTNRFNRINAATKQPAGRLVTVTIDSPI
jgi:alkylhydroperoxidase family enzyme